MYVILYLDESGELELLKGKKVIAYEKNPNKDESIKEHIELNIGESPYQVISLSKKMGG